MFVKEKCVCIGKIVRTHGIHGQVIVLSDMEITEQDIKEAILVDIDGGLVPFFAKEKGWRKRDNQSYFLHFDHIDNKEIADGYCGLDLFLENVDTEYTESDKSIDNEYLEGYLVYDTSNKEIGEAVELLDFSGNVLLKTISKEDKEILIPFAEEYLISIDKENKKVQLQIPDGLLDL